MNETISSFQFTLNQAGLVFWDYAVNITLQTSLLILVIYCIDRAIHKKVRAVFRYALWMLVLVKLLLPSTFALPVGIGAWFGLVRGSGEAVPQNWHGFVFLFWLFGVTLFAGLLIQRLWFIQRLIAQSEEADEKAKSILEWCKTLAGVSRNVQLRFSPNTISPSICGLWNPTILLPERLSQQLTDEKLRVVLIHELAHLKRHDLWLSTLQTMLQIVHFYNPLLWFANAAIRNIRELATDEMVLVILRNEPAHYSNILLDIAEMAFSKPVLSLRLLGVIESKHALNSRITHMSSRPVPKHARLGVWGLIAVLVLGSMLLPMEKAQSGWEENWSNTESAQPWPSDAGSTKKEWKN